MSPFTGSTSFVMFMIGLFVGSMTMNTNEMFSSTVDAFVFVNPVTMPQKTGKIWMSTIKEQTLSRSGTDTNDLENRANPEKARTYKDIKEARASKAENSFTERSVSANDMFEVNLDGVSNENKKYVQQRIRMIDTIRSNRTPKEKKRSLDRLSKAQRMLQDMTKENKEDLMEVEMDLDLSSKRKTSVNNSRQEKSKINDDDTSNNAKFKSEPSTSSTSSTTSEPLDLSITTTTASKTTVPDTYWYNGNLQGGDYVTRWARGVKVAEPLTKYDSVATERRLFRQPGKWLLRNIQIGVPLSQWAFGVLSDVFFDKEETNRKNRAKQLQKTISDLGPAIIKGGQALASRSDLMPSEYLEELQKLQDDVPRFENAKAFSTVQEELGVPFQDIFELIYEEPIAAASIGQVYKARLKSNGDIVAIKIQRPLCEEVIALDLYVLRWWSGVGNVLFKLLNRNIDVQSIIDDFGELIYRELDYVAEAANAQKFSELYSGSVKDVFVPKVYSELTTSKVLTMEWVDGFRLTDSKNLDLCGLDKKKLVDTLVQCSLRQILENGFFHADPHGGNLLACKDGRLCYLDFGMMSYAGSAQRNGFLLAVVHIVNRDWDELTKLYVRLGFIPEGTNLQPISDALENTLPDALNADLSELNFKNVVGNLGDIMYTYPFSLPPFYIAIIRCLGVLEGLAIQVDPQARIISEAYPYIASRVLTDPQSELQEALRRLALTNDGNVRWDRLEGLLEKAKDSQGYDATIAFDQLTDYLISDKGEQVLYDLADEIVEGADSLGTEFAEYVLEASRALLISDEIATVRAFRLLRDIISAQEEGKDQVDQLRKDFGDALPDTSPKMTQFLRITSLLGATGNSSDLSKLFPIFRKLGQDVRMQRVATEMVAKLGERILSRSLRGAFGLEPQSYDSESVK